DRLEDELDRKLRFGVERGDDLTRIRFDLPQRFGAVKMLTAGDEPHFEGRKIDHLVFLGKGFWLFRESVKEQIDSRHVLAVGPRPALPGSLQRPSSIEGSLSDA